MSARQAPLLSWRTAARNQLNAVPRGPRLPLLILVLAAFALFVHHASPGMAMDGAGDVAHTCVAVAGHVVQTTGAPAAALVVGFSTGLVLVFSLSPVLRASRRFPRARAGPSGFLLPLRL